MKTPITSLRISLMLGTLFLAGHPAVAAPTAPRDTFLAAKHAATEANFLNDQTGLRGALDVFVGLSNDETLGSRAIYHAAWTEWMIAASQIQAKQPADAVASMQSGVARLRRLLQSNPDDGETHTLLTWMLIGISITDRNQFQALIPDVREHRKRALELTPRSPRTVMLDATMLFSSPQPGAQEKGLARWQETLQLVAAEKVEDPTLPDWGRTLADGWLANLYLYMNPPHTAEAREHALKALRERPDFWYVKTQVLPRTEPEPKPATDEAGNCTIPEDEKTSKN